MLTDEYIKEGTVKLEVRHFPLAQHDPAASLGAQAAECAADQGAFWPYHDRLFLAASVAGTNGFAMANLIDYARELGLDEQELSLCLTNQEQMQSIEASLAEGASLQVNSTPSIFINGKKMDTPFDYAALTSEIDRLLGESD